MRNLFLILMVCFIFVPTVFAQKSNNLETSDANKILWEIRMNPEDTSEQKESERWSYFLTNDLGSYGYDKDSIKFVKDNNGKRDLNLIEVETKTLFLNKEIIENLNKKRFSEKLSKGDSVNSCDIRMIFNRQDKTYTTTNMIVYAKSGKILQNKSFKKPFVLIPEESFAQAMYEELENYYSLHKVKMLRGK